MTNDNPECPRAVIQTAQGQEESFPRVFKENNADVNQPQPSNPPETPTPPPCSTHGTRAPEPMALPERHQAALRHIHTLETHNAKLYEDNCRLVNAVNTLNDRLTFFGAPQNTQVLRLADMQEKLRASEGNRVLINRKYQELLQCVSAGSPQPHASIELQTARDAYASLDREYRLLGDKYVKLKALVDLSCIPLPQPQGLTIAHATRGPNPPARCEFRAHDQSRHDSTLPTSVIPSVSFPPLLDQRGNHRRRSSESAMIQPPLRPGTTPINTTCVAPLPTPPPSAQLSVGQITPTGFPVHSQVPAGTLPLPHHPQMIHELRKASVLPAVPASRHHPEQIASEQLKSAIHLRQHSGETVVTANNESVLSDKQISDTASLKANPWPPKRPSSELQTSESPGGEPKKPRMDGVRATIDADARPTNEMPSSPASADPQNDHKVASGSDVRSYQDRVNLIFENDADVENGVFCGLCLDRYEAKMILEPPDVLIQPDFDFLVRHCTTMHPTVWDDLRRKA